MSQMDVMELTCKFLAWRPKVNSAYKLPDLYIMNVNKKKKTHLHERTGVVCSQKGQPNGSDWTGWSQLCVVLQCKWPQTHHRRNVKKIKKKTHRHTHKHTPTQAETACFCMLPHWHAACQPSYHTSWTIPCCWANMTKLELSILVPLIFWIKP